MAQTANDLLGAILVSLKSIENTTLKASQQQAQGGGSAGARVTISSALAGLGRIKKDDRQSYTSFVQDIANIAKDSDPKQIVGLTEGIVALSNSLPDIAKGLDELGKIKTKRVDRAKKTMTGLYEFFYQMGDSKSQKRINRAINSFHEMGKSLNDIAKPLNSMAFFMLKLGISIVGFVGSLMLASMMLGAGDPLTGLGIIVGIVVGLVGLMALIGLADKQIKDGSKTIASMGIGLMALAGGLVLFTGALLLIPQMLGESADYAGMAKAAGLMSLIVVGTAGVFWLIGKMGNAIIKGAAMIGVIALGMVILAGAGLVVALAAKSISGIAGLGEEDGETRTFMGMEVSPFVFGLGTLGTIILGGIGLFALLGIPAVSAIVGLGAAVGIGVSIAMIAMAYSVKELVSISQGLGNVDIGENISTMVGGVLRGFADGMWMGLAGGKAPDNWVDGLKQGAKMAAKVALIMGGIALISGVAVSLSLFALSLRAFSKVGQIAPITGHDDEGKPIYGKPVTVSQVASNVANSIGVFFTTLSDVFSEDGALPSKEMMDTIVYALMGKGGFSLFGVPVASTGPNLMDALYEFGNVLTYWGRFGEEGRIPMGNDSDGKPIQGPKLTTVAKNIAGALGTFMRGLSSEIINLDEDLADKTTEVAYILLGKKNTGLLGWAGNLLGITRDRPGILEPVSKFGEIIQQFASGQYIKGYDADGNPQYERIDYKKTADNIVKGIQHFTRSLADGLTKTDSAGYDYGKAASSAGEFLEDFEDLFVGLEKLSSAQSGMDRLATSLHNVGEGIGLIAENVGVLDADKFDQIATATAAYERRTADLPPPSERAGNTSGGANRGPSQDVPDWDNISSMIGQQVGQQISAVLSSGQFKFEFQSPTGGVMTIEPD